MIGLSQRRWLSAGMLFVFLLVFCGQHMRSDAAGPTGSAFSSALPVRSSVTVQVGRAHYHPGNTMHLTIKNQSTTTISFADHQTNCTVLLLERRVANSWEPVAPCQLKIMTHLSSLPAGAFFPVVLSPSDHWLTGQYRATLEYSVQSDVGVESPTVVSSNTFSVR
ncbi:MAG: hypothetical protein H0V70_20240 [Ktedonobacteraceae bacterium]|nr:hypothetical protein [Ktedonobacteraceae bacterium]